MRAYIYHQKFSVKSINGHNSILPSPVHFDKWWSNFIKRVRIDISGPKLSIVKSYSDLSKRSKFKWLIYRKKENFLYHWNHIK